MNWLKHNLLLGFVLLLLATLLATEVWLWSRARQQARRALAALAQKTQERDWLVRQTPAPSAENEQAIARDLADTQQVLAALHAAFQGKDPALLAAPPPAKSIDLYFDLAAFVEKTRALLTRAQVKASPDERFGFASHANEGPAADLIPAVFRQRLIVQYLVETLIEARPRALLTVQRERPLTAAQRAERNLKGPAGGPHPDFFDFDEQMAVRVPGRLDSDAFRLEFTGQTPALRAFLNSLATFRLPVIVRSVEVEPLAAGTQTADQSAPFSAVGTNVPLVTPNLSKFVVVVECIRPAVAPEESVP